MSVKGSIITFSVISTTRYCGSNPESFRARRISATMSASATSRGDRLTEIVVLAPVLWTCHRLAC